MIAKKVCASRYYIPGKAVEKAVQGWSILQYKWWKKLYKVDEFTTYLPKEQKSKTDYAKMKEKYKLVKKLEIRTKRNLTDLETTKAEIEKNIKSLQTYKNCPFTSK